MSRKGTIAIVVIVALAAILIALNWQVLHDRFFGAPCCDQMSQEDAEAALLSSLKNDWPRLEQGPLLHDMESGHWFLDAAEFIGPSKLLIHYDDGLNDEYALINELPTGTFEVLKRFKDAREFQDLRTSSSYSSAIYKYDADDGTFTKDPTSKIFEPWLDTATMTVKIAWLDPSGALPNEVKSGDISGCDHVVLQERTVPKTPAPLAAALTALLADKTHTMPGDGLYNYIGKGDLKLASVSIVNGTAKIYLTGTAPGLAGECDDPRLFVQVAQTARQFTTVQKVELYINGKKNDGSSNLKGE